MNLRVIGYTSTGRLLYIIFSSFADFESNLIIEKTQENKEIVRQRLFLREGQPKSLPKQIDLVSKLQDGNSYTEVGKMTRMSKSTLIRYNKQKESFTNKKIIIS